MGRNRIQILENGVEVASATFDIFDFAPVVTVNTDKEGENVLFSVEDCGTAKKEKLELGDAFDEEFRTYLVPELVIVKNSTSKIPIKILQGYDPTGSQDNDGIVVFSCSNTKVNITVPDGKVNTEENTIEKNVSYGDEFEIEISHTLGRGEQFSIEIKGKDDADDLVGTSDLVVTSGKLNFSIVEKDVFMSDEGETVLNENDDLRGGVINYITGSFDKVCYRVVDKQFSEVVGNPQLVLKSYAKLTAYDRIKDYVKGNYIESTMRFDQSSIWTRTHYDGYRFKPKSFREGKQTVITDYIKPEIDGKMGYHIYYLIVLDAYHVLTLLVDNRNLCNPQYKILDQIKNRDWNELDKLDNDLLEMTINNYDDACDEISSDNHNSSLQLWKLKRK